MTYRARGAGAAREDRAHDAEGVVEDGLVEREALGLAEQAGLDMLAPEAGQTVGEGHDHADE